MLDKPEDSEGEDNKQELVLNPDYMYEKRDT